MPNLRISLTLPGAVSLGAYEGGALAALLVAVKHLGEEVITIDTIASASAGSITGLLAASSLLRGSDPVTLLAAAWVDQDSIAAMRTSSTESPLSSQALTDMATRLLGTSTPAPTPVRQAEPITLSMSLTSLAGLTYQAGGLGSRPVTASTYQDWALETLGPADDSPRYVEVAAYAIASGSNAMGFPPKLIDRSADAAAYQAAGLAGFPADGKFWYTDGGTTDNEPLGRTIDLAQAVNSDDRRLFLLIHPEPDASPSSARSRWIGDAPQPRWLETAYRALSISRGQSIYDDVKRLQQTNKRLAKVEELMTTVDAALDQALSQAGLDDAAKQGILEALAGGLASADTPAPSDGAAPRQAATEQIRRRVLAASGLDNRDPVDLEIISPSLDPADVTALEGAFLGHFGGFLDVAYRRSDFCRGYRNMQMWLTGHLDSYLEPGQAAEAQAALTAVDQRYTAIEWRVDSEQSTTRRSISLRDKAELARMMLHVGHVVSHDAMAILDDDPSA